MSQLVRTISILTLTLLLFINSAFCEELKIFDSQGLIRAFSKVDKTASVQVVVSADSGELPQSLGLSHLDGLSPDRKLIKSGPDSYKAGALDAGSWKIILPSTEAGKRLIIKDVKILK